MTPSSCNTRGLANDIHEIERMVRTYNLSEFAYVLATIFAEYAQESGISISRKIAEALFKFGRQPR